MFRRLRFMIFNWLKPLMDAANVEFKNDIIHLKNREAVRVAEKLREKYEATLTPEKRAALQARPPIGGCSHRKGIGPYVNAEAEAKGGENNWRIIDYNVAFHTFPDCTQKIWCMRCNEAAWNRHGEKTPNWEAFLELTRHTTNHQTQSEIAPEMLAKYGEFLEGPAADWIKNAIKVVYLDKL
jgi:hypothetical protein